MFSENLIFGKVDFHKILAYWVKKKDITEESEVHFFFFFFLEQELSLWF